MSKHDKDISRRKFLGQASCAALGTTTLFSSLINLKAINAAAVANSSFALSNDYKALVCILLGGGNDSFNMLIPKSTPEWTEYSITRSNLAIPQNDILQIDPLNSGNLTLGVHPSMPEVQQLFNNGRLAFINNVGTLVEPTTKAQYQSGIHPLPLGLYSHSDQTQQWQTGRPHERSSIGWGGRVADLVQDMNTNENISMNISLSGTNIFQQSSNTIEFAIGPEGATGLLGYGPGTWLFDSLRTQAVNTMLDAAYQDIYKKTYASTLKGSIDANIEFEEAINMQDPMITEFSENELSQSLAMIAKVIQARQDLGFTRQIFFVHFGGWDHHDEVLLAQEDMLGDVSTALDEFNNAMNELQVENDVTTFSVSEFARTLTSNGNGTDHAWGGNVMVMGGAVNGANLYGAYPSLALNNPLEVGGGVLIPTTSADEYFAELALWFGVENGELYDIFPNLSNFYPIGSVDPPIGFLNI